MEDTLRVKRYESKYKNRSLNPCFNGRYSQSWRYTYFLRFTKVLILVLMEDTLRVYVAVIHQTRVALS